MVDDACRRALEKAYLYLDAEVLSPEERGEIEVHLRDCPPCYERYGLERAMSDIITRLRGSQPCPEELRSRIAAMLESHR